MVSFRLLLRRGVIAVAAVLVLMAVPAVASADTFSITPCSSCTPSSTSFHAGQNDSFTMSASFAGGETSFVGNLAPGLLTSLSANPACLAIASGGASAPPSTCQVGNGVANPGSVAFNVYLVGPTSASDVAGWDIYLGSTFEGHVGISLHQITSGTGAGQVVGRLSLPIAGALSVLTSVTFNVNGTLNGNPYTRMPTNCSPALPSSMTITYSGVPTTTNASPDVKDNSGYAATCGTLPYSPQLTAAAQKDSSDNGVAVQTVIAQGSGQAGTLNSSLVVPSQTLGPNAAALPLQNSGTPVGTAALRSPLASTVQAGQVFLTGSAIAPTLTVQFPAPYNIRLVGAISFASNSLTFSTASGGLDLPDMPLSSLGVSLNGGPRALFTTSCLLPTTTIRGSFTAQNGKTASSNPTVTVSNCGATVGKPTVGSKSLSGLGNGKPRLKFTINAGTGAPNIKSLKVSLPRGLKFAKKLKKGLKVSGGKVKSAKVQGGKLVITLNSAVSSVTVALSKRALKESSGLKKKAKKKKVKSLTVKVNVTDANSVITQLSLKFKKPK